MTRHLRMIKGGLASPESDHLQHLQLFRPYSIGDLKVGDTIYHDVRFNWYCFDRSVPIGEFEKLIANYNDLDAQQRRLMESEVNRCLLAEEVDDLHWYLRHRYGLDVIADRVVLPLRGLTHLLGDYHNVVFDFLQLTENTGYSLLIKVWGYYTTAYCLASPALESGVAFLWKALQWLSPGAAAAKEELETVVKRIYQEEGLYVERASKEVSSG